MTAVDDSKRVFLGDQNRSSLLKCIVDVYCVKAFKAKVCDGHKADTVLASVGVLRLPEPLPVLLGDGAEQTGNVISLGDDKPKPLAVLLLWSKRGSTEFFLPCKSSSAGFIGT